MARYPTKKLRPASQVEEDAPELQGSKPSLPARSRTSADTQPLTRDGLDPPDSTPVTRAGADPS